MYLQMLQRYETGLFQGRVYGKNDRGFGLSDEEGK